MESSLELIRAALVEGATDEQRASGVAACRAVLATLAAAPGQPLDVSPSTPAASPVAGLSIDHVLELAIAKLRSMLPADQAVSSPHGDAPLTIRMFKHGP